MSDSETTKLIQNSQIVHMISNKARDVSPIEETTCDAIKDDEQSIHNLKSHKPKNILFSYESLSILDNFVIRQSKDKTYFGQFYNKVKQGKGVMLQANGRVFEGNWENDRKHGQGYEEFATGAVYVGYFSNNKPHGFGKYEWTNGEIYEGEWLNGTKHGNGMWVGVKKDKYVGEWQNGMPHGQGVHSWINGDRYEGEFSQCLKSGYGTEKFGNGDSYEGYYNNGKPDGKGRYLWNDGSIFKGFFQNGLRFGAGEYISVKYKYRGAYLNDTKSGQGEFIYPDGKIYKGNFFDDQKHGVGILCLQDGSQIKQKWVNGKLILDDEKPIQVSSKKPPSRQRQSLKQPIFNNETSPETNQNSNRRTQTIQIISRKDKDISLNKTQIHKFVKTESPKKQIFQNGMFKLPPSSSKTQSFQRTKSEHRHQQSSEDILGKTVLNVTNKVHPAIKWIPMPVSMTRRPKQQQRIIEPRFITPEPQIKRDTSMQKPQFSLRFEPIDSLHFKTQTGLKGIKKSINADVKNLNVTNNNIKLPDQSKIIIRIRSISNQNSSQIKLF